MATNKDLVQYIADQMARAGEVPFKKMFGDYGLYLHGKFFAMVCDDHLLFKPTEAGRQLLGTPILREPHPGGKPCFYVENVDDHELLSSLAIATCKELPEGKKRG